jgi:hypothetical protein
MIVMTDVTTEALVERLAADIRPVRRLSPPMARLAYWLVPSLAWVGLVVWVIGLRPDIAERLADPVWLTEQAAALLTALTAAVAALCAGVPGRPRWERLLPVFPAAAWLGVVAAGCLGLWAGRAGGGFAPDWLCFPGIVLVGSIPALLMVVMLRRGAPLRPRMMLALGALAAAALANVGLRLFHMEDAALMVLVWQMGTVVLLTVLGGTSGRRFISWRSTGAFR